MIITDEQVAQIRSRAHRAQRDNVGILRELAIDIFKLIETNHLLTMTLGAVALDYPTACRDYPHQSIQRAREVGVTVSHLADGSICVEAGKGLHGKS